MRSTEDGCTGPSDRCHPTSKHLFVKNVFCLFCSKTKGKDQKMHKLTFLVTSHLFEKIKAEQVDMCLQSYRKH